MFAALGLNIRAQATPMYYSVQLSVQDAPNDY